MPPPTHPVRSVTGALTHALAPGCAHVPVLGSHSMADATSGTTSAVVRAILPLSITATAVT